MTTKLSGTAGRAAQHEMGGHPSCYKTAAGSLSECSTRRIKYLAPASSRSWPGIGCGTVGTEVGGLGAVLYRGGGVGKACNAVMAKGTVQRREPHRKETRNGRTWPRLGG